MNLILNRETFTMPADGWYQLAPLGEFAHAAAGVVQVVDAEACTAMAARFKADAGIEPFDKLRAERFAGLLVDFDHFSLNGECHSEAAGWIVGLEFRKGCPPSPEGSGVTGPSAPEAAGLWAKIRWSDVGEAAVKGGRYRFLSPVWARSDCVDLGPDPQSGRDRVRPVRLLNAAVTNDPNLKGMCALSNSAKEAEFEQPPSPTGSGAPGKVAKEAKDGGAPVDSCASNGVCIEQPAFVPTTGTTARRPKGPEGTTMKKVIERLVNHLGLPGDATEDVILEKMQGLPGLTAVADLQNSLKQAQDERDALKADLQNAGKQAQADRDALQGKLKGAEDELVNRHLAEFEGVISEGTKPFWKEQLLTNREGALLALADVALAKVDGGKSNVEGENGKQTAAAGQTGQTRRPLHNRAMARPIIPGSTGSPQGGEADSRAVKIRNRAHEIAKGEGVAFSAAFRRAEKEVLEG